MTVFLRHAGIVLLFLVAALVMLSCGAGECGSCAHAYCARSRVAAGLSGMLARMRAAFAPLSDGARNGRDAILTLSRERWLPGIPREVIPLRV